MVSSDYKFFWVDVSGKGSSSDAHIYNNSELRPGLENDDIVGWPRPDPLPHDNQDVPYFLVGDDAFALRTYLMKPYSARNLSRQERIFNYRLSRARRVVKNAFGILANRFQVLLTTMCHHADTVRLIVKACILLHNVMRSHYPVLQNRLVDNQGQDGRMQPGAWRAGQNQSFTDFHQPSRCSMVTPNCSVLTAQRVLLVLYSLWPLLQTPSFSLIHSTRSSSCSCVKL